MKTASKTALRSARLFTLLTLSALVTLTGLSTNAFAFPLTSSNWTPAVAIRYTGGFNFDGIVALSNCSGSLVRFKNANDTDKALMLTNGHCYSSGPFGDMVKPGEIVVNVAQQNRYDLLDKAGTSIHTLTTTRVLYAAMTITDVTLFELTETYADIEKATGVKALILADTVPAAGEPIEIASGYWHRTYSCKIDTIIPELREAGYDFKKSVRFSQPGCETIGGTSGSPIISTRTGEVIAINNTGNEDGEQCTMNNPCEVDDQGAVAVHQGAAYGQETYLFYGCLSNGPNRLDLNQPSCQLAKP